jgi:CheY-like chemotaxis protein
MNRPMLLTAPLAAALLFAGSPLLSSRADDAAVRATVQRYFDGQRNGDADLMGSAFAPGSNMIYIRDSALAIMPIPEFVERVREGAAKAKAAPQPATKPAPAPQKVASVDIAGNAAIARLETHRPDMIVVDYMTLLKIKGEWLIVNKSFDRVKR